MRSPTKDPPREDPAEMVHPTGEPYPLDPDALDLAADLDLADLDLGGAELEEAPRPDGFDPRWRPLDHTWGEDEPR